MIISRIGRKSVKVQLLYLFIYSFLIIGSLTMIYPFMLMISGSTKSAVDIKYFDAIPHFLYSDVWLYRKHIEGEMNEDVIEMNETYDNDIVSFEFLELPEKVHPGLVKEMREFLNKNNFPFYYYTIGYFETGTSRTIPLNLRKFKEWLQKKYGTDINKVNRLLDMEYPGWAEIIIQRERYRTRREKPAFTPFFTALAEFKKTVPLGLQYYFSPEGYYKKEFLKPQYSKNIEEYNKTHGTHYKSYHEVHLARNFPAEAPKKVREDWELFIREVIGLHFIKIDSAATKIYREFLQAKYSTVKNFNKYYSTEYKNFSEIELPEFAPLKKGGIELTDWEMFLAGWKNPDTKQEYKAPITSFHVYSPEFLFQDYLKKKYGTIDNLNKQLNCKFAGFTDILLPQLDNHYLYMQKNKKALKWEFCTRNYKAVAEYIIFHGRGVFNTVVYCVLQILCALTVNPLAAYAMSRYKMPSSYKILLFLLCTMAFPPMVTGIPSFLMLRKLGLLNTFAALILPGMANGYAIFLLKGFFDSQPKELYECAQLDGANEWVLFWHIAMSLSKPILAVIALQAFTLAYSNFMFAFVVCQDKKMWTLMVWLYQLQQYRGQAVMYASLLIAAIPTFLIFLFCQNIIMRGIVVPSEK